VSSPYREFTDCKGRGGTSQRRSGKGVKGGVQRLCPSKKSKYMENNIIL
jgi:hypothetical protein